MNESKGTVSSDQEESLRDWITKVETLVKGLGFLDPAQLPPHFRADVLKPLESDRQTPRAIQMQLVMGAMLSRLARLKDLEPHRHWFFWQQWCRELQRFSHAEKVLICVRHGATPWLSRPAGEEEEAVDLPVSAPSEAPIRSLPVEAPGQRMVLFLEPANWGQLALIFSSAIPVPRISETSLYGLHAWSTLWNLVAEAFVLPCLPKTRWTHFDGTSHQANNQGILGSDPRFLEALDSLEKAAESEASVFLRGESGTGKELFARRLHAMSSRAKGPFVAINCSAVPHDLIESEMFGHEKGAFTGAYFRKIGRVEQAHGGTLFLDEIGEMPLAFQAKLLRFLQEKSFTRVGGNQMVHSDARVVVATHRDLKQMVAENRFREDLYYRIHVIPVEIPPLRERGHDIRQLAEHFFSKFISQSRASRRQVDDAIFEILEQHPFPGNVRELENMIQRTVVMAKGRRIRVRDLPQELLSECQAASISPRFHYHPFERFDHCVPADRDGLRDMKRRVEQIAASYVRDLERRFLLSLLDEGGGSVRDAAQRAGINRTLFYKLLKRAGIDINSWPRGDS